MRSFGILFCLVSGTILYANTVISTSQPDVYYRGGHEQIGWITLTIDDDDFSTDSPAYFRFWFEDGITLADTLVDPDAGDERSMPINLSMRVLADEVSVLAPIDAVSIVRWVAGEASFWILFQSDSDDWLTRDGGATTFGPSEAVPVAVTIGVDARTSAELSAAHATGGTNLPFNTREVEPIHPRDAISTPICLDLSASDLAPGSILRFNAISASSMTGKRSGLPIYCFCGAATVRGREAEARLAATGRANLRPGLNEGLLSTTRELVFEIASRADEGYLPQALLDGSSLTVVAPEGAGMTASSIDLGCNRTGTATVNPETAFTIGDEVLYREVAVTWAGGRVEAERIRIDARITLHFPSEAAPPVGPASWALELVDRDDGVADAAPFDGPHQIRRCGGTSTLEAAGQWPAATSLRPVLPHITATTGGFQTDLVFTNSTDEAQAFSVTGYDIAGNEIGTIGDVMEAGDSRTLSAPSLLDEPSLSHLAVMPGSPVIVSAAYRALGESNAPADVFPGTRRATSWRIEPGRSAGAFDGLALVNVSDEPVTIVVEERDSSGQLIATVAMIEGLEPFAKALVVLSQSETGTAFETHADGEIAALALRGTRDGRFLWESPVAPMIDTGAMDE